MPVPDDASGNFSLVSGYLAVTGQTVQPSNHNPPLEDIAAAMTNRLSRSGVAPMTGPIKTITGSAGAPAIYPNSNPAIGIYWTPTGISFAGSVSGVRFIGELIPYTLLTAPALTVFPYGQTLLRASYPDLWTIAQSEIAAGNTFYNNGNGSTTFGIGDLRGRVVAGKDNMGGGSANRLLTSFGSNNVKLGAVAGQDYEYLTQAMLPAVAPTFSGDLKTGWFADVNVDLFINTASVGGISANAGGSAKALSASATTVTPQVSLPDYRPTGTISNLGSGAAHTTLQPTLICNFLLYAGA